MAQTQMQKAQAPLHQPLQEEYDHDLQEIHEKINHDYEDPSKTIKQETVERFMR